MLKHLIEVHENVNQKIDLISVKIPRSGQQVNLIGETADHVYRELLRLVMSLGIQAAPGQSMRQEPDPVIHPWPSLPDQPGNSLSLRPQESGLTSQSDDIWFDWI